MKQRHRGCTAIAVGLALSLALAGSAAAQTIETVTAWGGSGGSVGWGPGNVPTYAQTFTMPSTDSFFRSATFYLQPVSGPAASFQALVFAWNGSSITGGPLHQSGLLTAPSNTAAYTPVQLSLTGLRLAANAQYIILLTTATAGSQAASLYRFGRVTGNPYAAGQFLANNSNGFASGWVLPAGGADRDLAFLFSFGVDPANTAAALRTNAQAVSRVLTRSMARMHELLEQDCTSFDQYGLCLSVGFRGSQLGDQGRSGEVAASIAAAWRPLPQLRIGGFIDQTLQSQVPGGVAQRGLQPNIGGFAVYQQHAGHAGLTLRAAFAHGDQQLRVTRPALDNTEPGSGRAALRSTAFAAEAAYGFALDGGAWVLQPHAGLRRSGIRRIGYAEASSTAVSYPISYGRFGQYATSATAGLRLRGQLSPQLGLVLAAGAEYDLQSRLDRYTASSAIDGLETVSLAVAPQRTRLRGVAAAGIRYAIAPNQVLAADVSARQTPFGSSPAVMTMLRYSIGF